MAIAYFQNDKSRIHRAAFKMEGLHEHPNTLSYLVGLGKSPVPNPLENQFRIACKTSKIE